jgi:hypothetical protein
MAGYKDPPKHTRFKPGQSGNPAGRKRCPFTMDDVKETFGVMMLRPFDEVVRIAADPTARTLDKMAATAIMQATSGNYAFFNGLFDRTIGKVRDESHVTVDVTDEEKISERVPIDRVVDYLTGKKPA